MQQRREREPSPASTTNSEETVCDCPARQDGGEVASHDRKDYFICCRCARLQHLKCHSWDQAQQTGPEHFRCNQCHTTEIEELHRTIESKQEQIQAFAEAINRKREEVKEVIMEMLWRHYCHLPNGDAPAAVQEACKLKFEGGKMVPEKPAPESWVRAAETNLEGMMESCGRKVTDFVVQPEFYAEEMNSRVLTPMREIAVDLVNRGAYRDSGTKKLGVIGEVLGLEMKGTVWKG
jgi:hypothetical protein